MEKVTSKNLSDLKKRLINLERNKSLYYYMDWESQSCGKSFQDELKNAYNNIEEIRVVEGLPCEGILKSVNGKYFIEVNKGSPPNRRLFTVFHEIAHIILAKDHFYGPREKEKLCNKLAAELLIPDHLIPDHLLNWDSITIREVQRTAARLCVSLTALLIRIISYLGGTGGFIWFREMPKPTDLKDVALRVENSFFPEGSRIFIPKFDSVPNKTLIYEMWSKKVLDEEWSKKVLDEDKGEWFGKDRLNFGSLREERFIRGKKFKQRLLVIVYPQDYKPVNYKPVKITDFTGTDFNRTT